MTIVRWGAFSEHAEIMKIAKLSKYTRDFSNHIFSGESMYNKGWISVATGPEGFTGFYCVRHKVRVPKTTLYFIGVDPNMKQQGIASSLLRHMKDTSPHKCIELNC